MRYHLRFAAIEIRKRVKFTYNAPADPCAVTVVQFENIIQLQENSWDSLLTSAS